jgi:Uma2 family endonuclease
MVEAMVKEGILSEEEPVYLWKGRLARRMAPQRPHALTVGLVVEALRKVLGAGWHVEEEKPLAFRLSHSAPEPDIAILRGQLRDYSTRHPTTSDAALVFEVADSPLRFDRKKAAEYAAEGIPAYWIVDLVNRRIETFAAPEQEAYRITATYERSSRVPVVIEGTVVGEILVDELLP